MITQLSACNTPSIEFGKIQHSFLGRSRTWVWTEVENGDASFRVDGSSVHGRRFALDRDYQLRAVGRERRAIGQRSHWKVAATLILIGEFIIKLLSNRFRRRAASSVASLACCTQSTRALFPSMDASCCRCSQPTTPASNTKMQHFILYFSYEIHAIHFKASV